MTAPPARLDRLTLPYALLYLRLAALWQPRDPFLHAWCRDRLGLSGPAADAWCRRARWGLAAGELVRRRVADRDRCPEILGHVGPPDWTSFQEAYDRHGAVILASAHVGPPKAVMHVVSRFGVPTLIWTNKRDLPTWVEAGSDAAFLDPTSSTERRTILPRSAIHLRANGVLVGAPDHPTGRRTTALSHAGLTWRFSFGIPALVRKLDVPAFLLLGIWKRYRLRLVCEPIEPPPAELDDETWYRAWIKAYWQTLEPHLRGAPENLRQLRHLDGGRLDRALRGRAA